MAPEIAVSPGIDTCRPRITVYMKLDTYGLRDAECLRTAQCRPSQISITDDRHMLA